MLPIDRGRHNRWTGWRLHTLPFDIDKIGGGECTVKFEELCESLTRLGWPKYRKCNQNKVWFTSNRFSLCDLETSAGSDRRRGCSLISTSKQEDNVQSQILWKFFQSVTTPSVIQGKVELCAKANPELWSNILKKIKFHEVNTCAKQLEVWDISKGNPNKYNFYLI